MFEFLSFEELESTLNAIRVEVQLRRKLVEDHREHRRIYNQKPGAYIDLIDWELKLRAVHDEYEKRVHSE
jgi:hypothetical protein